MRDAWNQTGARDEKFRAKSRGSVFAGTRSGAFTAARVVAVVADWAVVTHQDPGRTFSRHSPERQKNDRNEKNEFTINGTSSV